MLLARTLNQTASFHSSLPVKCPVVGCLLITYAIILEQERINSENNSTDSMDDKNKDHAMYVKYYGKLGDLYNNTEAQKIYDLYAQLNLYKNIRSHNAQDFSGQNGPEKQQAAEEEIAQEKRVWARCLNELNAIYAKREALDKKKKIVKGLTLAGIGIATAYGIKEYMPPISEAQSLPSLAKNQSRVAAVTAACMLVAGMIYIYRAFSKNIVITAQDIQKLIESAAYNPSMSKSDYLAIILDVLRKNEITNIIVYADDYFMVNDQFIIEIDGKTFKIFSL